MSTVLGDATIKFGADVSGLKSGVGQAKDAVASFDEMTRMAAQNMAEALAKPTQATAGLTEATNSTAASAKNMATAWNDARIQTASTVEILNALKNGELALADTSGVAATRFADMGNSANAAFTKIDDQASLARGKISSIASGIAESSGSFLGKIGEMGHGVMDFGSKLMMTVFNIQMLGQMIGAVGKATIGAAGDFQAGMASLVTGAGESQKNIKLVSDGILAMAGATGTSTKQLVDGMYMIESGGYHGAAGLAILKAAAEGAKVGNANLGVVADATDTILKNFGNTGLSASGAVNTLIATVAHGKTHMEDLSKALSQILPTASAAKVGLNDVMGAMATMTGEGVPAANAATYLRQTIIGLEAPSSGAKKALADVGLTTQQVSTEMQKSLPGALQMITDAVGKKFPVGSAAYIDALKNISGGSKTMQGMLDLTGQHLNAFKDNVATVADQVSKGGTSIVGWSDIQDTFNQKMDQAKAATQALMISVGAQLLPVVTKIAGAVVPVITGFADWVTKSNAIGNTLHWLGGILSPIADVVGKVKDAFHYLLDPMQQLQNSVVKPLTDSFDRATGIFNKVQNAIKPIAGTFDQVRGAIDKAVVVAKPLVDTFDRANGIIKSTAQSAKDVTQAFNPFVPLFQDIGHFLAGFDFSGVVNGFKSLKDAISGLFAPLQGMKFDILSPDLWNNVDVAIKTFISGGASALTGVFNGLADVIKFVTPAIHQIGDIVEGVFSQHFKTASGIVKELGGWFQDTLIPAFEKAKPGFEHLADAVTNTLVPGLFKLWAIGQSVYDQVAVPLAHMFEVAAPVVVRLAGAISDGLGGAFEFLMPYVLQAGQAVADFAGQIADHVAPIVDGWFAQMNNGLNDFQQNWQYIWPTLSATLSGVWDAISGTVEAGWGLVKGIVLIGLDALSGNWGQLWDDMAQMVADVWNGMVQSMAGPLKMMGIDVDNLKITVDGKINQMKDSTSKSASDMSTNVSNSTTDMKNNVISNFSDMQKKTIEKGADISSGVQTLFDTLKQNSSDTFGQMDDDAYGYLKDVEDYVSQAQADALKHQIGNNSGNIIGKNFYGYAEGGDVPRTDYYKVGERGPEIVQLQAGSHVYPHGVYPSTASSAPLQGSSGSGSSVRREIHIHVELNGQEMAYAIVDDIGNALVDRIRAEGVAA